HVEIHFTDGSAMVYTDPRRFGFIDHFEASREAEHPRLKPLGPEPLTEWTSEAFATRLRDCQKAIKTSLLDQKFVVGVGNIYACEALFGAGLSPRRKAGTVRGGRAERLVTAIRTVLRRAIEDGGTSLRDHVQPGGEIGYFVQRLSVYGRAGESCHACGSEIRAITQSGRSSFYCPACQR
ncbi:MAG: bifunctional DNA-formamidopyrimidine glycosylase/DNA-(apurinic or apyrimidinic site) lyase, partial [Pseudomonadota bacterium]|nr:bifunctional DNA-formamidopyrimidine glycosylase/DNA-(apurinic or apyrimidinic site) lyase [Pseudomonadota bacterium]